MNTALGRAHAVSSVDKILLVALLLGLAPRQQRCVMREQTGRNIAPTPYLTMRLVDRLKECGLVLWKGEPDNGCAGSTPVDSGTLVVQFENSNMRLKHLATDIMSSWREDHDRFAERVQHVQAAECLQFPGDQLARYDITIDNQRPPTEQFLALFDAFSIADINMLIWRAVAKVTEQDYRASHALPGSQSILDDVIAQLEQYTETYQALRSQIAPFINGLATTPPPPCPTWCSSRSCSWAITISPS